MTNEELNEKYSGMTLIERIRAMHSIRQAKDAMDEQISALEREHEYLAKVAVPSAMEDEGIELLKVEGVGRVNLRGDLYASIVSGKKEEAFAWLLDTGRAGLITETVNASSLKASIKQGMANGESFPEELFKVTPYSKAVITKA